MKFKSLILMAMAFSLTAHAQVFTFGQTSLVSPIASGAQQIIYVASSAGMTVQPQTMLYVGLEAMLVLNVNGNAITVTRGKTSTRATPQIVGEIVLVGRPDWFDTFDRTGGCVASSTYVTPSINLLTGNQWLCSTVTLSWVPGFTNQHPIQPKVTAAVASAAGLVTPSGVLFHLTGTAAITGFNIPVGFSGGAFCAIPDGIFTTTTAANIALASTAVVGKTMCFQYDQSVGKFFPSY